MRLATVPFLLSIGFFDFPAIECNRGNLFEKLHNACFGPKAILAALTRNKRAVSATGRSIQTNIRVLNNSRIGEAREWDEWIVLRSHHKRRHSDPACDAQ